MRGEVGKGPSPGRLFVQGGVQLLVSAVCALVPSGDLSAQWRLARWEGGGLELGGYVRVLTAVHDAGFDQPGADRRTGFGAQVLRLKWTARGESWVLEVHDRLQARLTSAPRPAGASVVGIGVSAVPDRSLDLETDLVDEERFRLWHDLDRLALTVYTDAADVTVGRQAITWGLATLFPVADLWSRFSPFELDTEEKPGIDAVRVLAYPAEGLELDAVLADRGRLDDTSVGVRAAWTLGSGDLYLAAGKFWREAIVLAGGTYLLDEVKLRAEVALPWELDDVEGDGEAGADDPRVTAGIDWIHGDWLLSGELHFNGVGTSEASEYLRRLATDPRLSRGESYYLGRWQVGGLVSYRVSDRLSWASTALVNLADPSASVTPVLTYDLGRNARISLGGLLSAGEEPRFPEGGEPLFGSEFGSYGTLGWSRVSLYF